MSVQVQSPAMKPSGVSRKPIARKSVSSSLPQSESSPNVVNNDAMSGLIPVSTLEGTNYAPVELPASPVPSSPNSIGNSSISSFTPSYGQQVMSPNTMAMSPVPQYAGGQANSLSAPPSAVQSNVQPAPIGNSMPGSGSSSAQPTSNHARRMARRNMMMNVTATVGSAQNSSTSSPALSPAFISPPATITPAPQSTNTSPVPAAMTPVAVRPLQAGVSAQWGNQAQNQPVSLAAAVSRPVASTRQSLPAGPVPSVPGLGVSFQVGAGSNQLKLSAQTQRPVSMLPTGAAPLRHNTEPQLPSLPSSLTIAYKPQRHSTAAPIQPSSPVQMKPPNQRTMSIQSTLTVGSTASTLSATNSASSPSSPLTTVTTPSTMYSPINQAAGTETIRRPPASELGKPASYFSLCNACKKGTKLILLKFDRF